MAEVASGFSRNQFNIEVFEKLRLGQVIWKLLTVLTIPSTILKIM